MTFERADRECTDSEAPTLAPVRAARRRRRPTGRVFRAPERWARVLAQAGVFLACATGCGDDDGSGESPEEGGVAGMRAGSGGSGGRGGASGRGGAADPDGGIDSGLDPNNEAGQDPMPDDDGSMPMPDDEDGGLADVDFTGMERAMMATLSPLPDVPPDPTNAVADNAAAAALGQMLFYETSYSGALSVDSHHGLTGETGKISCFSCHSGPYLDDQRSQPPNVSLGAGFHSRNAPTTINSVFYQWTNWGGRFSAPWELPIAVAESPVIMNSSRLRLAHVIFDTYRTEYEAVFGAMEPAIGSDAVRFPASGKPAAAGAPPGVWEAMTDADRGVVNLVLVNFGKAIEAYLRKLVSRNAPFDRFIAGDEDALDQSEKRGLRLFLGDARCFSCHSGPLLADNLFHNLGVPQTGDHVPASDDGRFKDIPPLVASPFNSAGAFSDNTGSGRLNGLTAAPPESTRGQFRTPSLRGVALTAPYMHSGQLSTLEAVVAFYVAGGGTPVAGMRDAQMVPLDLDRRERADLIAFLGTLTGEAVPEALLDDTSK